MTAAVGSSFIPVEARHRSYAFLGDGSNWGYTESRSSSNTEKDHHIFVQERSSSCKFFSLKFLLVIIIFGTCVVLLHSPTAQQNQQLIISHARSERMRWLWKRDVDQRYISDSVINWGQISRIVNGLLGTRERLLIGLLNFNSSEIIQWQTNAEVAEYVVIHLECANENIAWRDLFPEWIDEEEDSEVPTCPVLPVPSMLKNSPVNVIAVKLPCHHKRLRNWSRDIARLHLQLAAANVVSSSYKYPIHVLFITDCFPSPNLFACKDLIIHEGNTWLYKPNHRALRKKLQLPVGSCQLSLPVRNKERLYSLGAYREAYATILHSAGMYVCGAIAAAQSIRQSGSTKDLVILVDKAISDYHRKGLEAAGWKLRTIQRIRNPKAEKDAYNEWNYSKFRLWQLTDYDKIIFIDADLLILRNIDFLFRLPEISATGNNSTLFNSGVMVIEPSNCTFQLLMDNIDKIESYNGGDQGYLNEIFTWWHRIPKHVNFLKHFWEGDEEEKKIQKIHLFGANPPILYVLHYLGNKPWLCFRDYDCNWNVEILQQFASDVAHAQWWKVHDRMPKKLQKFCLLRSKQKAQLEWDRRQAEKANYTDAHWKWKINDPRLNICSEDFCFWESMLWHWGEKNQTAFGGRPSLAASHVPRMALFSSQ